MILSPSPLLNNDFVDCDNNQIHGDEQKRYENLMNLPVKGSESIKCRYVFSDDCVFSGVWFGIGNNQCTARLENSVELRND